MAIIQSIAIFISDYFDSENKKIIDTITDIHSPAYTYLFLWIFIRIHREINFKDKF